MGVDNAGARLPSFGGDWGLQSSHRYGCGPTKGSESLIRDGGAGEVSYQRAEMVEVPGSCDSAAEEGDALANMSVCAAHDGDGRADGGENRHDELNDVFDGFLFHGVKIKGF